MPNKTLVKWEEKTLSEVCTITAGQSPESQFYNTEGKGLPFYQGKKEFTNKIRLFIKNSLSLSNSASFND